MSHGAVVVVPCWAMGVGVQEFSFDVDAQVVGGAVGDLGEVPFDDAVEGSAASVAPEAWVEELVVGTEAALAGQIALAAILVVAVEVQPTVSGLDVETYVVVACSNCCISIVAGYRFGGLQTKTFIFVEILIFATTEESLSLISKVCTRLVGASIIRISM